MYRGLRDERRDALPHSHGKFHVEVADLIKSGRMPQKKEAAIQLMVSWFENTQKQKPSRSAVSEKLTPYYRRFFTAMD